MNTCDSHYQLCLRLNEIQAQLYKLGFVYSQSLSGLQVMINQTQHRLSVIKGYLVLDASGNQIDIHFRTFSNLQVEITSNIDMTGLTLYLF